MLKLVGSFSCRTNEESKSESGHNSLSAFIILVYKKVFPTVAVLLLKS